jgi:hypothetical protein
MISIPGQVCTVAKESPRTSGPTVGEPFHPKPVVRGLSVECHSLDPFSGRNLYGTKFMVAVATASFIVSTEDASAISIHRARAGLGGGIEGHAGARRARDEPKEAAART